MLNLTRMGRNILRPYFISHQAYDNKPYSSALLSGNSFSSRSLAVLISSIA